MSEIKDILITVPPPVSIGVREMSFAGAMGDSFIQAFADLMSIRVGMGMDAGTVTGEGETVIWNEPMAEGRDECSETEKVLEPFFIMERKFIMREGVRGHGVSDAVMFIREFPAFAGLIGRLRVLILREKVLPAGFL